MSADEFVVRLQDLKDQPLKGFPKGQAAAVVARVVDRNPVMPKLDVSAFNSSI